MKLIVIDGVDGVGKSFIADKLVERLKNHHVRVVKAKFPDASSLSGENIYSLLKEDFHVNLADYNPFATWMTYAVNRYEFFVNNKNDIQNSVVVADRYSTTSAVYQTASLINSVMSQGINDFDPRDFCFESNGKRFYIKEFVDAFYLSRNDNRSSTFFDALFSESFEKAMNFMLHFEYNILRIPVPDIVFTINVSDEAINENLQARNITDRFERDNLHVLREYIFDKLNANNPDYYQSINNTFSEGGIFEIDRIMTILKGTEDFKFLRYVD